MGQPEHDQRTDFDLQALLAEADWVAQLARHLTRDWQTAGDVAQGAMAIALEKRPSTYAGLRPWLSRVVSTLALQERRGAGRRRHYEGLARGAHEEFTPSAEELVLRVEAQQKIAAAVCGLPEPYREVLLRRYYEGQSCEDIAAERGQAPSTVRSQLSRGIARLRTQFERPDDRNHVPAIVWVAAGQRATRRGASLASSVWPWAAAAAAATAVVWTMATPGPAHPEAVLPPGESERLAHATLPLKQASASESARVPAAAPREEAFQEVHTTQGVGIRVRIVDRRDNPLPEARLVWDPPGEGRAEVAFVDEDGYADLVPDPRSYAARVASGQHVPLRVQAPGRAERTIEWHPPSAGLTAHGRVEMWAGGTLTGRAVDAEGLPIEGAVIVSARENEGGGSEERRRTGPRPHSHRVVVRSDSDGLFVCSGLKPGSQRLWLRSDSSLWILTPPHEVAAGESLDLGRLELEPAREDRIVSGVVTLGGRPVAGAEVAIEALTQELQARTRTDAEGVFRYAVPTSKPLAVVARLHDDTALASPPALLRAGGRVELELQPRAPVEVHVVDASGRPLRGCAVRADLHGHDLLAPLGGGPQALPGGQGAITGARGAAHLELPVGEYRLRAAAQGYRQEDRLTVRMPGTNSVILRMLPETPKEAAGEMLPDGEEGGARIELQGLLTVDRVPAEGWTVEVLETRALGVRPSGSARTDRDGRFATTSRKGTIRLRARGPLEGRELTLTVERRHELPHVPRNENLRTAPLRFQLDRPLTNARLVLGQERSGRHAILELGSLPAGQHTIRAPQGMLTLQEARSDGSWVFVGVVDVSKD